MAQYYQVLSQDNKNTEEVTQFYQNVEEGQTVQYVIAAEGAQQQFQTQPVVVSSDQLMVVEGQGQPVIIDQSQITYQSPSYIVQESPEIDYQNNQQQQIYYMANNTHNQSIVVEQTAQSQPVVLNHHLMQNQINKISIGSPVHQTTPSIQEKVISQLTQQIRTQIQKPAARQNIQMNMQKTQQNVSGEALQSFTSKNQNDTGAAVNKGEQDYITLPDGTLVTLVQYRKLMATQKQNQVLQERMSSDSNMPIKRVVKRVGQANRGRTSLRGRGQARGPVRVENQQTYNEPNASPNLKQGIQQQYQQNMQQREPQLQQQSQPVPRLGENRPRRIRRLPAFLQYSQIQAIIDNTPQCEEFSDSIRMLVLLENGEQRLITFTLPKEACTIHEILDQVQVPFTSETVIDVLESDMRGLHYVVTVGKVPGFDSKELESEEYPPISEGIVYAQQSIPVESSTLTPEPKLSPPLSTSPETPKGSSPKLVEGKLAVCAYCGYLSEDFNKCTRCKRKLPENVKAIPAVNSSGKKVDPRALQVNDKRLALAKANGIVLGVPKMNLLQKKRPPKPKIMECETVVVSSDDEETEKKPSIRNVSEQLLEKLGSSVTISPISKEPSVIDIQKNSILASSKIPDKTNGDPLCSTVITCRTVRIGSYKFSPLEPVRIDSNGAVFKVPHPKLEGVIRTIRVDCSEIVKVLVSFQKTLPVLFYYLLPSVGASIRGALDMTPGSDLYFDPLSETEEAHRRITLLPEILTEESKHILQKIYSKSHNILDELTYKEANDILIKTCPKDTRPVVNYSCMSGVKQLLSYPPEGRGRIGITAEDYMCLGSDQFLNDVIIDFYLKYLWLNLPKEQQDKIYVFSTFFYKRLTTKPVRASRKSQPSELDPNLTASEKRHCRVKTWTKNVNLFNKDFIIVPINENCHWFLAIICFPNMNGCHTMEGQSIRIEPRQPKKKKVITVGNVTISTTKDKNAEQQAIMCEDPELSDKDEAEGDDSELDSDDSEGSTVSVENNSKRPPIKQPCILIFDSLAGTSRSRVVATLRDYLTCEYKAKMNAEKVFTKDVIKGACPKVPQQTNFTDCGLYLLQYVEQFFKDPIKDYYIPIKHIKNWFEEMTVTRKREEISLLIISLMKEYGRDLSQLPEIVFPTLNGELTEIARLEQEGAGFVDPDEEMMEDEEDGESPSETLPIKTEVSSDKSDNLSDPMKPSQTDKSDNGQVTLNNSPPRPDTSEISKQTSNKNTLCVLRAKRIIRNKHGNNSNPEEPEAKKAKT